MSCNTCKKKEKINLIEREVSKVEKPLTIGLIIVGLLSLYGIYSLIIKTIALF